MTPSSSAAAPSTASTGQLDRDRLNSLVNSMADGVLAVDHFTNIEIYNGAVLNILDLNSSLQGKPLDHVLSVIDNNNQPVDIVDYVRSVKIPTVNESFKLKYGDGSTINLYLSISPVTSGFGKQQQKGYVLVLRDITRAKSLEEERDEFISVVSHELRTPIAIAEGNLSNALFVVDKAVEKNGASDTLSPIKQALVTSHDQTMFLASMINDLATLSRAERGKLVAEIEQINIHDLVEGLVTTYTPDAKKKGLEIHKHLDPHLELLASSQLYVREVLQNFITNSIKYTEKGSVTISAKPRHAKDGVGDGVVFAVSDTGIGISKSDQEQVFDKFFRSEDFRTRQNNGTGLGLYVTMKLARLLHAEIDVTSQLNHGSTFTIFIPNLK